MDRFFQFYLDALNRHCKEAGIGDFAKSVGGFAKSVFVDPITDGYEAAGDFGQALGEGNTGAAVRSGLRMGGNLGWTAMNLTGVDGLAAKGLLRGGEGLMAAGAGKGLLARTGTAMADYATPVIRQHQLVETAGNPVSRWLSGHSVFKPNPGETRLIKYMRRGANFGVRAGELGIGSIPGENSRMPEINPAISESVER